MPRAKNPISTSPKPRTAANYRASALYRLKSKWEAENDGEQWESEKEPIITPLLKMVEGGIDRVMEALRAHDDDDARDFIDLYDSLSAKDKQYLTLEEISFAAGIGSLRLGEIANTALILHSKLTTSLLLASNLHRVVSASIKQAIKPSGLSDREWMLKAGGILPVPKGATIAIQTNVAGERAETKTIESETPQYLDPGQRLRMIHEAVESRRLPAPKSEPIELGGRIDHIQREAAEILVERE
jgi:hypothetical protein